MLVGRPYRAKHPRFVAAVGLRARSRGATHRGEGRLQGRRQERATIEHDARDLFRVTQGEFGRNAAAAVPADYGHGPFAQAAECFGEIVSPVRHRPIVRARIGSAVTEQIEGDDVEATRRERRHEIGVHTRGQRQPVQQDEPRLRFVSEPAVMHLSVARLRVSFGEEVLGHVR